MPIDYALSKSEHPRLKAALTRAVNSGSSLKVVQACHKAVIAWDKWGAWPDQWSRWENALYDAIGFNSGIDLDGLRYPSQRDRALTLAAERDRARAIPCGCNGALTCWRHR